ncbi:MAG: hypothetical protein EBU81_11400, partial [Proteobacteria bacterium]|nr:hypothetical protein [Pseudomonadota bacterium]
GRVIIIPSRHSRSDKICSLMDNLAIGFGTASRKSLDPAEDPRPGPFGGGSRTADLRYRSAELLHGPSRRLLRCRLLISGFGQQGGQPGLCCRQTRDISLKLGILADFFF